ncbi:MAG: TIGR04282 family arsenosugar biosynthesis glycosyltransferase [Flavobacteriales bacterium]|nr:TIGR04282 family arsenosugar biosynthesis glycosyltransferase [Flavobacteriales bacterium]
MDRHLIIFIKNPVLGRVKTRLAATIGDGPALEVYHRLLAITRSAALGAACTRHLYYSDSVELEDDWNPDAFHKHVQQGNDLGERMMNAFAGVFAQGAAKAVIIGSDCPEIFSAIIDDAFVALDDHDVAVGPAKDGGYYLLGMRALHPEFFRNKHWSTGLVLSDTIADASKSQLRVSTLPMLSDLDDEADLKHSGLL